MIGEMNSISQEIISTLTRREKVLVAKSGKRNDKFQCKERETWMDTDENPSFWEG